MDIPWLPDEPYTWREHFGWRRAVQREVADFFRRPGVEPPPEEPPSETELRWQAEDEWLTDQWRLTME
jgi:hypothetical protein